MRSNQAFPILRVAQGQRGVCGQLRECRLIVGGEFADQFIDDFENAEHFAFRSAQRHRHERFRLIAEFGIDAPIHRIVRLARRNPARLAGAQHFSDHAGIVGHAQLAARHAERGPCRPACGSRDPTKKCSPDRLRAIESMLRPSGSAAFPSPAYGSTAARSRESFPIASRIAAAVAALGPFAILRRRRRRVLRSSRCRLRHRRDAPPRQCDAPRELLHSVRDAPAARPASRRNCVPLRDPRHSATISLGKFCRSPASATVREPQPERVTAAKSPSKAGRSIGNTSPRKAATVAGFSARSKISVATESAELKRRGFSNVVRIGSVSGAEMNRSGNS